MEEMRRRRQAGGLGRRRIEETTDTEQGKNGGIIKAKGAEQT